MRIAVVARTADRAGGAETYVQTVVPLLLARGHEVALCVETVPAAPLVDAPVRFIVDPHAADAGCPDLRRWRPDVVFVHGLQESRTEDVLLDVAPNVLFAHTYRGTCISGTKTRAWPRPAPCERPLGWGCVGHYFPRRCGGRSPWTLACGFREERRRQSLLPRYARVLTLSGHMRREYVRNGVHEANAFVLPFYAPAGTDAQPRSAGATRRLLYLGRMEPLKGGAVLLDALPAVRRALGSPLDVTFAGDGRCRDEWQRQAAAVTRRFPDLSIRFPGWLDREQVHAALDAADLLVLPSVWPEPFGLVGPEAAARGVPAAAFAVGGIPEWLQDGVNGHLAPAAALTGAALAEAVVACLRDPAHHAALRAGARSRARQHPVQGHVEALVRHLAAAAAGDAAGAGAGA